MNTKRFVLAVVAVYVALAALGLTFYEYVFAAQFEPFDAFMRPEAEMMSMMAWNLSGHLVQVTVFCFIFLKGYENKGVMEGVRYGILIGLYMVSLDVVWYAALPIPLSTLILWAILDFIMMIIAGIILAAIYKPAEAPAPA